uniref:Zinc finger/thioredoxin putative domain-containing protein n=1 Tax=candidate division WOR-3 bacterium TaxID=2052148 RepID=A0A7C4TDL3_UNCW3
MIVECSGCHTKYNIDENKIPPAGIKVRCHKCGTIIFLKKEILKPPEPVVKETEFPPPPEVKPPTPEVTPPKPPEPEIPQPPEPKIPETPVVTKPEVVSKPPTPPVSEMSEEDKKWHERAKRLAKALASDLVLYNQEKVEQGLRDGTLVQLLGAEIKRSWEYYCQQIPKHIVESTDYFREQLNKIVGKGKEIFK